MASLIPAIAAAAPFAVEVVKSLIPKTQANQAKKQKAKKVLKKARKALDIIRNDVNEEPTEGQVGMVTDSILAHNAPFAQGTTTKSEFKMTDKKSGPFKNLFEDGCSIDCVEYLGDLSVKQWPAGVTVSKGSTIGQYFIHPRTIPSSRLDLMARNYTHYIVEHVEVVYEPIVAATTPGALCIGLVEDPKLNFSEGEKGLRQLLETKDAVMFPVWQIQTMNHRMSNRTIPLVTRVGGSDMNLIFQGKIVAKAASDLTAGNSPYGNIVLKYRIHFYGTYLSEQDTPVQDYEGVALYSASVVASYYNAADAIFSFSNSAPAFVNAKAYDRIVGVIPQVSFTAKIGLDPSIYTFPAGRVLYGEIFASFSPSSVINNIGPLYLSMEALLQKDYTERVVSTAAAGSAQVVSMPIQVWDLDYEYNTINNSASIAATHFGSQIQPEKTRHSLPLELVRQQESFSSPTTMRVPVAGSKVETRAFTTYFDSGSSSREGQVSSSTR